MIHVGRAVSHVGEAVSHVGEAVIRVGEAVIRNGEAVIRNGRICTFCTKRIPCTNPRGRTAIQRFDRERTA